MSHSVEGKKCQVCNAYLFDDDDVVICPECGAPYHRECYDKVGNCALAHLHGTDEQYCEEEEDEVEVEENNDQNTYTNSVKCKMCNAEYSNDLTKCPECGAPNFSKMGSGYAVFDFLGGVPGDTDLGDGVTADEAKKFVMANSYRYIPKFFKMKLGKKASWNWLAFLVPGPWMLSRKMYALGSFVTALTLISDLFLIKFNEVIYTNVANNASFIEVYKFINEHIANSGYTAVFVLAMVGSFISMAIHILSGILGDYWYRNNTISGVKKIKETEDNGDLWRKRGGVSFIAMFIGLFIHMYAPEIIASFLL